MFKMHFMKIIHSNSLSNLDLPFKNSWIYDNSLCLKWKFPILLAIFNWINIKVEKLKYNQLIWTKVEAMMIV